jgi:hypothetical protein
MYSDTPSYFWLAELNIVEIFRRGERIFEIFQSYEVSKKAKDTLVSFADFVAVKYYHKSHKEDKELRFKTF